MTFTVTMYPAAPSEAAMTRSQAQRPRPDSRAQYFQPWRLRREETNKQTVRKQKHCGLIFCSTWCRRRRARSSRPATPGSSSSRGPRLLRPRRPHGPPPPRRIPPCPCPASLEAAGETLLRGQQDCLLWTNTPPVSFGAEGGGGGTATDTICPHAPFMTDRVSTVLP